jgi:2-C-methyl-D-erythritol 4-phosphate cytidylyltransferase
MKVCALVVAGGASRRFGGDIPKQYVEVGGKPLLSWTISRFEDCDKIDQVVVVVAEEYLLYVSERVVDPYDFRKVSKIVIGGSTRRESVLKGLEALPISTGYVAIHDGARPMVSVRDIDRVVTAALEERAAILAAPTTDTVKRVRDGFILSTHDRSALFLAQTPQVFQYDLIIRAHRDLAAQPDCEEATDDASIVERAGFKVKVVEPSGLNLKVTSSDDLLLVKALLGGGRNE